MGKREWQWSKSVRRAGGKNNGGAGDTAAGCMSGILHFLDFHQLLFTTTGSGFTGGKSPAVIYSSPKHNHHHNPTKGMDAPRNSLEMDEGKTSTSSAVADEYYDVPVGIQITVPSAAVAKMPALAPLEEERSTKEATPRTPNLIARLMGLTVLPDELSCSPASSYKSKSVPCSESPTPPIVEKIYVRRNKKKKKQNVDENVRRESYTSRRRPLHDRNCNIEMSSRSLPDTPRVSSARPSWDVDHRLSLQVNKENHFVSGQPSLPSMAKPTKKSIPTNQIKVEINKSPRSNRYANDIVKQIKESISNRRAEDVVRSVRTKPARVVAVDTWKPPPAISPPTTRFLEPRQKLKWLGNEDKTIKLRPKPLKPKPSSLSPSSTRSSKLMEKIKKQRPTAVSAKSSPTTSPATVKVFSTPTLHSFVTVHRKELSTSSVQQCGQYSTTIVDGVKYGLTPVKRQSSQQWRPPKEIDPEFHYVKSVLLQAGILGKPLPCLRWWYSPIRPVDPIIFYKLEMQFPYNTEISEEFKWNSLPLGPLKYRWNRKLLFHLVQEILPDISEYHHQRSEHCRGRRRQSDILDGESVLHKLWLEIRSFPEAHCRVAGDIDTLMEGDLREANIRRLLIHPSVTDETEELATVMQNDILDSILEETVAYLVRDF